MAAQASCCSTDPPRWFCVRCRQRCCAAAWLSYRGRNRPPCVAACSWGVLIGKCGPVGRYSREYCSPLNARRDRARQSRPRRREAASIHCTQNRWRIEVPYTVEFKTFLVLIFLIRVDAKKPRPAAAEPGPSKPGTVDNIRWGGRGPRPAAIESMSDSAAPLRRAHRWAGMPRRRFPQCAAQRHQAAGFWISPRSALSRVALSK